MMEHLFTAVSMREKMNDFIEHGLLKNGSDHPDHDAISSGFVFIRRFPQLHGKTIEKYRNPMHIGLVNTLNRSKRRESRQSRRDLGVTF